MLEFFSYIRIFIYRWIYYRFFIWILKKARGLAVSLFKQTRLPNQLVQVQVDSAKLNFFRLAIPAKTANELDPSKKSRMEVNLGWLNWIKHTEEILKTVWLFHTNQLNGDVRDVQFKSTEVLPLLLSHFQIRRFLMHMQKRVKKVWSVICRTIYLHYMVLQQKP